MAVCTAVGDAVRAWTTRYSLAPSLKSLKSTTATWVSETEPWTPETIEIASVLAWAIDAPMLPVVSMAIRMSALGGTAGTSTEITWSTELPAATWTEAVAGSMVAPTTVGSANEPTRATTMNAARDPARAERRPPDGTALRFDRPTDNGTRRIITVRPRAQGDGTRFGGRMTVPLG